MVKKTVFLDFIIDISAILIISTIYYLNFNITIPKTIYVPQGSISKIITNLNRDGLDILPIDTFFLRFIGSPQHGVIEIKQSSLSKADFLYSLTKAKAKVVKVTLIPSDSTVMFLKKVAKQLNLSYYKLYSLFMQNSPWKEGFLTPDTHFFPITITEEQFIKKMLNHSYKEHKKLSLKLLNRFDKKEWFIYVIIASIIEKESGSKLEMPLVSSVIYNRLKKGMKLQMDGTLNYGIYSRVKVTRKRIREDSSKFNTYKNRGLPPYPVTNVSKEAIISAIYPKKTDYLYFVKVGDKKHKFSKTYKEHLKHIKKGR